MEKKTLAIIFSGVVLLIACVAVAVAVPLSQKQPKGDYDTAIAILEASPLIDGHNDWTYSMRTRFDNNLSAVNLYDDWRYYFANSHTDIPRIRAGRLGGQFWSCFTSCDTQNKDAVRQALEQIDVMKRFVHDYPETFQLANTADEIEAAFNQGKVASLIGMEGGHMIDSSMAALRMFYELGTRYMTLTHSCNTPWAVSANAVDVSGGLTEFGEEIVLEMNRLGMLVDIAHVSTAAMRQVLSISTAPVIFSHSSVRSLCDRERNVPDDVLEMLKTNRGVIMINFYNNYITCNNTANVQNVADHYDYVKNLIGVDYIGVGADYDGVPRTPEGLEDVSTYPNLVVELLQRGWTEDSIKKITGQNILRVMREAENVAAQQKDQKPNEKWISPDDVAGLECRT